MKANSFFFNTDPHSPLQWTFAEPQNADRQNVEIQIVGMRMWTSPMDLGNLGRLS
jgi:hypothetical protein